MAATWHRIERRDALGQVSDWVEVGCCDGCGRGVDREFPVEYHLAGSAIFCRECAGERRLDLAVMPMCGENGFVTQPPEVDAGRHTSTWG